MQKHGTYISHEDVLLKNGTTLEDCTCTWNITYTVDNNYGADRDGNRGCKAMFTDELHLEEVTYGEQPIDTDDVDRKWRLNRGEFVEELFFMSDQCDR